MPLLVDRTAEDENLGEGAVEDEQHGVTGGIEAMATVDISMVATARELGLMYSFDGILVFGLLFICTCAYFRKVPRLNSWLLSEKKGVWGVFHKAAVIGTRLHIAVAMSCLAMAFYVVFLK